MRVSVALATHNGVPYLGDQLRSILAQTRPPDEIVVSDDASTDGTVQFITSTVDGWPKTVSSVLLQNSTALGVTANFERAVRSATGDVVFLCDQDDLWHPTRVADALAVFEADPDATMVVCDARLVDGEGLSLSDSLFGALRLDQRERRALQGVETFAALMRRNLVTGATTAIRRELVERAAPFPSAWVHDEWLGVVAAIDGSIRMIPKALVDYRQHGANAIGVRRPRMRDKIARISADRTQRNELLLRRAEALAARFGTPGARVSESIAASVQAKLKHEQVRNALPPTRLLRLFPVLWETTSGRYSSSGGGAQDILRDLVQPAGEHTSG